MSEGTPKDKYPLPWTYHQNLFAVVDGRGRAVAFDGRTLRRIARAVNAEPSVRALVAAARRIRRYHGAIGTDYECRCEDCLAVDAALAPFKEEP